MQTLDLSPNFRLIVNTFIYEAKTSEYVAFHHKASYLNKETAALETVLSYILLEHILCIIIYVVVILDSHVNTVSALDKFKNHLNLMKTHVHHAAPCQYLQQCLMQLFTLNLTIILVHDQLKLVHESKFVHEHLQCVKRFLVHREEVVSAICLLVFNYLNQIFNL